MGRLDYYSKLIGQAPQESDPPKSFADLTKTKRTSARPHHRETNVYSHTFLEKKAQSLWQYHSMNPVKLQCLYAVKNMILKFLKCSPKRRRANMTDLELQKDFIQVSLRWFEVTLGQLLRVTKEHILGVADISSGAAFLIIRFLLMSPFRSQETLNVSISERFLETLLRLAYVGSRNFHLDFKVILPCVFQKSGANTLVIFALMHNFSV